MDGNKRANGMDFFQVRDYPQEIFKRFCRKKIYSRLQNKVRTIALHKPGAGLGDVVLCVPIFRALKKMFPRAKVVFFGTYSSPLCDSLLEAIPYIDEFVVDNEPYKSELIRNIPIFVRENFRRFDLIVSGNTKFKKSLRLWLSCPKYYISRDPLFSRWKVLAPSFYKQKDIHVISKMAAPLRVLGAESIDYSPAIDVPQKYFSLCENLLNGFDGQFVSIAPSSGNFHKNWGEDKYALLADRLSSLGYRIILLGREEERDVLLRVKDGMTAEPIIPLCSDKKFGKDPIYNIGFLKRSLFAVSNDGGGCHLASLAGCPVVGLYGPSTPEKWGPLGKKNMVIYKDLACSPCEFVNMKEQRECVHERKCLRDITVDEVMDAAEFILRGD